MEEKKKNIGADSWENNSGKMTNTTRRNEPPKYRGIKAMPFVIGNETFERLGTIGTSSNLLIYHTSVFHMTTMSATTLMNIFNGTCNLATLVGAFLSDTYFGRYRTLAFASMSSFLITCSRLMMTAAVSKLHPPSCGKEEMSKCVGPNAAQMAVLLSAYALLAVGAGGIRPCNLAFGADQFNPNTESGRRGTDSFFNWYYFTYTCAVMVSMTFIVYIQSNISWSVGLSIPCILMFLSCTLFFLGTKIYVRVKPQGSPLTSIAQVITSAFKKRRLKLLDQPSVSLFNHYPPNSINSRLSYSNQFRFLDKAAIITSEDKIKSDGSAANPWRLSSMQQVEEVKCLLRVFPIWIGCILYFIPIAQQQNYLVFQALQSDRRIGHSSFKIPAATYNVFSMLALSIWLPIYDRIVIQLLRRKTGQTEGITPLQRIGVGMVLSVLSLIISATVETRRRTLAFTRPILGIVPRKGAISSMSALWLIPQIAIQGISEGFTFIAENELFYKQFPENMRSIAASVVASGVAIASYLSAFLASVVQKTSHAGANDNWLAQDLNKGRLDYFFYLIAAFEILNLGFFLVSARWYKYKGTSEEHHDNDHNNNTNAIEIANEEHQPGKFLV